MQKKHFILILTFFIVFVITGCKPKEPEFNADVFLKYFEGIERRNKMNYQISKLDYFNQDYIPNLNPADTVTIELEDHEIWEELSLNATDVFYKEDGYQYYGHLFMKERFVPVSFMVGEEYEFRFHKLDSNLYFPNGIYTPYGYAVDFVEYANVFGYILLLPESETNDMDSEDVFYLLANTKNLPYDIYYETKTHKVGSFNRIYLIPKDENFSKKCLERFKEKGTVHYYDIDIMKEMI